MVAGKRRAARLHLDIERDGHRDRPCARGGTLTPSVVRKRKSAESGETVSTPEHRYGIIQTACNVRSSGSFSWWGSPAFCNRGRVAPPWITPQDSAEYSQLKSYWETSRRFSNTSLLSSTACAAAYRNRKYAYMINSRELDPKNSSQLPSLVRRPQLRHLSASELIGSLQSLQDSIAMANDLF